MSVYLRLASCGAIVALFGLSACVYDREGGRNSYQRGYPQDYQRDSQQQSDRRGDDGRPCDSRSEDEHCRVHDH